MRKYAGSPAPGRGFFVPGYFFPNMPSSKLLWLTAYDQAFAPIFNDFFLPSWEKTGHQATFNLDVTVHPKPFGSYGSVQFTESYTNELQRIRAKLEQNLYQPVVWTDADLFFAKNTTEDILQLCTRHELCSNLDQEGEIQSEDPAVRRRVACTAFQFFIVTPRLLAFYDAWVESVLHPPAGAEWWLSPQDAYNYTLRRLQFDFQALPTDEYWTVGLGPPARTEPWKSPDPLPAVPKKLKVFHANWAVGVENKLLLLEHVRRETARVK